MREQLPVYLKGNHLQQFSGTHNCTCCLYVIKKMLEEILGLILYMPLQFYSSDIIGCNKGGDKTMALNRTDANF